MAVFFTRLFAFFAVSLARRHRIPGSSLIRLEAPNGVAPDGSGNLFISDIATHRIPRLDSVS
jgi:hypothetical protein